MAVNLHPGVEVVAGYPLVRSLGRGGFGEVWEALAPGGVRVALKFIRLGGTEAGPEQRALETIRNIRHPHLLDVQFALVVDDCLVIAMPLCDRSLKDRLDECKRAGLAGIPRDELIEYLRDVARAVDYLNEPRHPSGSGRLIGVQHRDIKPHNIFLVGGSARLADFGLAKVLDHSSTDHTGGMSPHYVSPEVIQGRVSSRTDQYSLAVTYVQLCTGRLPFGQGSVHRILFAHVHQPPDLAGLCPGDLAAVRRALSKDPEDRWPDCRAFLRALESGEAAEPDPGLDTRAPEACKANTVADHDCFFGYEMSPSVPAYAAPNTVATSPTVAASAAIAPSIPIVAPPSIPIVAPPSIAPPPFWWPGPRLWDGRGSVDLRRASVLALLVATCVATGLSGFAPTRLPASPAARPAAPHLPSLIAVTKGVARRPAPLATLTNGIGMNLVLLPSGKFLMGAPEEEPEASDDEKPQHRVRIEQAFYMGAYEVTQGEYQKVMGVNPSWFAATGGGKAHVAGLDTSRFPVEQVSWKDAVSFCNKLSDLEGLRRCYADGEASIEGADGYRLPTEAEWEYACRAGTTTAFAFGDRITSNEANFDGEFTYNDSRPGVARERSTQVGSFPGNAFGLFDMHGNVSEWCADGYDGSYQPLSQGDDPDDPEDSSVRMVRGGGMMNIPRHCRSATRLRQVNYFRSNVVGFRVARTYVAPEAGGVKPPAPAAGPEVSGGTNVTPKG
ncbi:bifunctional serine/threonine-protein kinase/formylglycine-generating enzyme family protein [Tundrisphaera sp. TA3]|uniref:bifunctional serine/threonine-protein kinase/formylglycine-generating enzyme family protein n=1 Tax=Tundrisphaera sp. TA3 TaxID=3435775 RepID=UPI003EC0AE46